VARTSLSSPVSTGRLALLWLAGLDLRVTLLAVPPLLPLIHAQLQLDEKGVAALTSLPVLVLGLAASPGSLLVARVGARRALRGGLLTIAAGSALRGVGASTPLLFAGSLIMGAGIAISQPSIPALVRQWFPTMATRATGIWSSGLLIGEFLGASLTLPVVLPLSGGSWETALGLWSLPVLITAGLLALGTRHVAAEAGVWRGAGWPDWRQPRTWQLGLLQSSAALIYFGTNTFLPDYLHASGQPELLLPALTAVNLAQVPASLVVGAVPWRILSHRASILVVGGLEVAGLPALASGQPLLIVGAAALLGFLSAYVLVVCFALPVLLAGEGDVARMSAGSFTVSYATSFTSNLVAGALWDATHLMACAFLPVLLGGAIVLLLGPRLLTASAAGMPGPVRAGQ
jgi:CP family cyanate transporter-like MFS transporter